MSSVRAEFNDGYLVWSLLCLQDRKQHVSPTWRAASWRSAVIVFSGCQNSTRVGVSQLWELEVCDQGIGHAGSFCGEWARSIAGLSPSLTALCCNLQHSLDRRCITWPLPSSSYGVLPVCVYMYLPTLPLYIRAPFTGLGAHTTAVEPHVTYYTCNDPISK